MTNAFLRIRPKLLKEDRIGQFIGTALVEMILIIAGILLALQIDNWNQTRQERRIVEEYLDIIKHNVTNDLENAEAMLAHRKQSLLYTDTILGYYQNEHIADAKLFELGFLSLFIEQWFYPNRSAYESLKSSGFLRNVGNTSIEAGLNAYYALIDKILNSERVFNSLTLPIEDKLSANGFYIEFEEMFRKNHQDTIIFTCENLKKYPDVQSTFIRAKMWLESFINLYTQLSYQGEELLEILNNGI